MKLKKRIIREDYALFYGGIVIQYNYLVEHIPYTELCAPGVTDVYAFSEAFCRRCIRTGGII